MLSLVWLFVTPWTVVNQAPLFMKFSRQEYWSGCHFLLQGTHLTQGSNTHLLHFLHWRQILYHWATWEYQTTLPVSWEIFFRVKEQQLEPDMKQLTSLTVLYLIYMWPCLFNLYAVYIMWNAILNESQSEIKIAKRSISNLRYAGDTTLMEEIGRPKEPLDGGERGEKKKKKLV